MFFVIFFSKLLLPVATRIQLLQAYKALYENRGHTQLPWRYVLHCRVRLLTRTAPDGRIELRAGYCINSGRVPFRYVGLAILTPSERRQLLTAFGFSLTQCCELTGIVFGSSLSSRHRTGLYALALIDALLTGKQVIIGGSTVPKVIAQQQRVLRHRLFDKQVVFTREDGTFETRNANVYFAYRYEVIPLLMKCLVEDWLKQLRPIRLQLDQSH
ncbi:hypothetical protein [Fibrella forsythiae]|uniref:DUF535 domain-containing protein n=1 Tax=Fibrella forsythiae TaxID=2817061 RepID=A0ABS3JIB8_9BACT|nr:hypothetical protein [Fibrella forsythiae]MBO0948989.1 hypothetical protein [Fibrella forsythiae]